MWNSSIARMLLQRRKPLFQSKKSLPFLSVLLSPSMGRPGWIQCNAMRTAAEATGQQAPCWSEANAHRAARERHCFRRKKSLAFL